ncbi:MAG: 50S ribosomal protein L29 [Chloroflexi bacterium]|nr:50S ribosomal protein L29 [Chloroflexota bacterium]
MSGNELRAMTDAELQQKLQDAYQELFNLRFRQATKQLDNTSRIRVVRKDIARIKTVLSERQLGLSEGAA